MTDATGKPGADGDLWFWNSGSMVQSWEGRWRSQWYPHERLKEADMEHIMKTGAGWEIKADSHRVDELGDAVRPIVARLQHPLGWSLQRGYRAVA